MKNMGGISSVLNMLPGLGNKAKDIEGMIDEKDMARKEAIILSMTPKERANPDLLNPSRKKRIAQGAGVDIAEVNRMVKQFDQTRKMMKQFGSKGGKLGRRARKQLAGMNLEQLQNSIPGNIPGVPPGLMPKK